MNRSLLVVIATENRRLVILLVSLLLCCFLFTYLSFNRQERITKLQAVWSENRRQVTAYNQKNSAANYQQTDEALKKLMSKIPARSEFPRVLGQLMDVAAGSSVVVGGLSYKPLKSGVDGLLMYNLTCTANGEYPALKRFLTDIGKLDGLTIVESVGLSNSDPFEVKGVMEVSLSVYLREAP